MEKGFTLIELLVVVIIVGVLAALALPGFTKTKERVLDKEAKANLALVQAAEKIYRMENTSYYPVSGSVSSISSINSNLKLNLPNSTNWSYSVSSSQGAAARSGRTWTLSHTSTGEPTCSGTGCP